MFVHIKDLPKKLLNFTGKGNKYYKKLLLILAITIILFITGIVISTYTAGFSSIKRDFHNSNTNFLSMMEQNIRNQLDIVINIQNQVIADRNFSRYLVNKDNDPVQSVFILQELVNGIWSKTAPVLFIENMGVYLRSTEYIISAKGAEKAGYFFDKYIYSVKSSNELGDILKDDRRPAFYTRNVTFEDSFNLIGIISNSYINFNKISIIAHVRPSDLLPDNIGEGAAFQIYVEDTGIIAAKGKDIDFNKDDSPDTVKGPAKVKYDGEEYFQYYSTYKPLKWHFIYSVPSRTLDAEVTKLTFQMASITAGLILIGIIIAFLLTGNIYKPVNKMLRQFLTDGAFNRTDQDGRKIDEFELFNNRFFEMKQSNMELLEAIQQNRPILKESFLKDLLSGSLLQEEIFQKATRLDISFNKDCYFAVVVEIDDFITIEATKARDIVFLLKKNIVEFIRDTLAKEFQTEVIDTGYERIAIIAGMNNGEDIGKLRNTIRDILDYIASTFKITVTASLGKTGSSPGDIARSFRDASQALEYKYVIGQGKIIGAEDTDRFSEGNFYYPVEKEKYIINMAISGDFIAAKDAVLELIEDNFESRSLSMDARYHLLSAMAGTIIRIFNRLNVNTRDIFGKEYNLYDEIRDFEGLYQLRNKMINIFSAICENVRTTRDSSEDKLKEKLVSYIHKHYRENFSLNDMAEEFNYTPTYLSEIFKDRIGENFIEFLNKYRISIAKDLLANTGKKINEIAEEAGYNNVTSFIRVFKKYEGVSPGKFKEIC